MRVGQDVRGHTEPRDRAIQPVHHLVATPARPERRRLDHDQVHIGAFREIPAAPGPEQDHLLGVTGLDDGLDHLPDDGIADRSH